MSIRAVIFDLFDVLFGHAISSECQACETQLGLPEYGLRTAMLRSAQFRSAIYGQACEADLWQAVAISIGADVQDWSTLATAYYSCVELNSELLTFMRSLHPHYKIALLSNATPAVYTLATQRFQLEREVDVITISALVGTAKPHPEIYQITAQRLGVLPQEAIYVDDEARFVAGAQAVGMCGVQYKTIQQASEEIMSHLS